MFPSQFNHIQQGINLIANKLSSIADEKNIKARFESNPVFGSIIEGMQAGAIDKENDRLTTRLSNLEADFQYNLEKYSEAYNKLLQENINNSEVMRTSDDRDINVRDTDGNVFYVNKFGIPMKFTPNAGDRVAITGVQSNSAYENRHGSCPSAIKYDGRDGSEEEKNGMTNILGTHDQNVYLVQGVPCNIIGKNVRDKRTGEVYFITDKGMKRKYLDYANNVHSNCPRSISYDLDSEIMQMIPAGTHIVNVNDADVEQGCKVGEPNDLVDTVLYYNNVLKDLAEQLHAETSSIDTNDDAFIEEVNIQKQKVAEQIALLADERKKFLELKGIIDTSRATTEQHHQNSTTNFVRYITYISLIIVGCYVLYTRGVETTLLATFYLAIAVLVIVMLMEGFTNTVDKAKVVVSRYT